MDRDELERSIEIAIDEGRNGNTYWDEVRKDILSLLAPELADAEKWRKVKEAIDPSKLRTLAAWIDIKYPNDQNPQVQNDLRKWADALEGKVKG